MIAGFISNEQNASFLFHLCLNRKYSYQAFSAGVLRRMDEAETFSWHGFPLVSEHIISPMCTKYLIIRPLKSPPVEGDISIYGQSGETGNQI